MKQNDAVCVWVEIETSEPVLTTLSLYCVGTGHGEVHPDHNYLGSVIDGDYVWHIYT